MNKNNPQLEPLEKSSNLDPSVIKKAKEGDSFAQLDIGQFYYSSTDLIGNYGEAFYWLTLATEQKNMKAEFMIGDLYALGNGVEKNEYTAYEWYIKAAIQGYPKALTRLHNLYHSEKSMTCRGQRDSGEEKWDQAIFKKQNNIRELNEYRLQQLKPKLTEAKKYFECLFKDLREKNTERAYLTLGFLYQHGYGIRKSTLRAIEFYTLASEKGNADAQYNLASLYHQNHDMKWNYREAFKWYTKAVEGGSICAQNGLAFLYQNGLGVEINYQKAVDLYTRAAEKRHIQAQVSLGCIFRKGQIVDQDYNKAIKWYKTAAMEGSTIAQNCLESLHYTNIFSDAEKVKLYNQGVCSKNGLCLQLWEDISNVEDVSSLDKLRKLAMRAMRSDGHAMFEIGIKYYNGSQFKHDADAAFRWIRNAAKTELIEAQCKMAEMHKNGDTIEQNYHKASIWYAKAARKGDSNAQYNIGQMYYHGLGVRRDPLEASRWYFFAAEKENSDAQCQLGILYERGEGRRQDIDIAEEWYLKSARRKNAEAIYRLGRMKENANKPDFDLSLYLYKTAASLRSINAQLYLACYYSNEKTSQFNPKESFRYYEMASIQNNPEAKYKLAVLCLHGDGVDQDFIRAYKLFKESSALGYKNAGNIFQIPIDYSRTNDIDYKKLELMFKIVCRKGIASLEYNLGFHYEYEARYIYKSSSRKTSVNKPQSKHWYEMAASKNNAEAQYRLGVMHEEDDKTFQGITKAIEYYQLARENGNSDAMYRLARMYFGGHGVFQSFQKAFYFFREAVAVGHKHAIEFLGLKDEFIKIKHYTNIIKMLEVGAIAGDISIQFQLGILNLGSEGPTTNVHEALKWLSIASERGYIEASYYLGILYEEGVMIACDYQKAIDLYKAAGEKGHANSLYRLARIYHRGSGVAVDDLKAFEVYSAAAEHGNRLGQLAISVTTKSVWKDRRSDLSDGQVCDTLDYDAYFQMWEYVAQQGNAYLQYEIGRVYEEENTVVIPPQAIQWYIRAANQSHHLALFRLGSLYELGSGVKQDYIKAFEFYEKAAKAHNIDALCQLGILYQNGYGVEKNFSKALGYYKNAAKHGNNRAQFILGTIYEEGENVTKDFLEAFKWYTMAATLGYDEAEIHVNDLCNPTLTNNLLYRKWFRLLSSRIDVDKYTYQPERSFLGEVYYNLGIMLYYGYGTPINYERAWDSFRKSANVYGEGRAVEFLELLPKYIDTSTKEVYLKKLEFQEAVSKQLPHKHIYELALVYYNGKHGNSNDLENDLEYEIVKPNERKTSFYFKMITGQELSGTDEQYSNSSYYMGMVSSINAISKNDYSEVLYYLRNAEKGRQEAVCNLLKLIEKSDDDGVNKLVLKWHQENSHSTDVEIMYNLGWMHNKGVGTDNDYVKAFHYLKKAAEKGHSAAQLSLGNMYFKGSKTGQPDYQSAIEWYKKAAEDNTPGANYKLGIIYITGSGVDINYTEALKHFKIEAENGDPHSEYLIGYIYRGGHGVETNITTAIQWLEKAADKDSLLANDALGNIYFNGEGVEKDYNKSFKYFKTAAELGSSDAQFQVSQAYEQGYGANINIDEAFHWLKKATEQGHAGANYNMGNIYYEGQIFDKDYKKALKHYTVAANRDSSRAQYKIGTIYFQGYGVDKDYVEAIKWFEKSGKNNDAEANYHLGGIYFYGCGVDINYEKAFNYYMIAAKKGDKRHQSKIGYMYLNGYGVERDYNLAFEWFTKSAEQDSADANYHLGQMYRYGQGVGINNERAFKYFSISAENGLSKAQWQLGRMYDFGYGVERDHKKAIQWYKRAAKENITANYHLGNFYAFDNCGNKDNKEAFKYYEIAAMNGHVESEIRLGYCYFLGHGTDKNEKKGIRLLKNSSNTGDLTQITLGSLYHSASTLNQDFTEALKCYQKSSKVTKNGDPLRGIGLLYEHGDGVEQSYDKALAYYKQATDQNNIGAYYNLGLLYYNGSGVSKNYGTAFEYFSKVIESEMQEGCMYPHVQVRSKYLFNKQRIYSLVPESFIHRECHYYLGKMYESGQGVCVSHTKASKHLQIATSRGNKHSKKKYKLSAKTLQVFSTLRSVQLRKKAKNLEQD